MTLLFTAHTNRSHYPCRGYLQQEISPHGNRPTRTKDFPVANWDANHLDERNYSRPNSYQRKQQTRAAAFPYRRTGETLRRTARRSGDRKSTRLNSSHLGISYAVFCLKKKKAGRRGRPYLFHATRVRGDRGRTARRSA